MAIGEFDGAATLSGEGGLLLSTPMYWLYEMGHAALSPARAFADATRLYYKNPANPLAHTDLRQIDRRGDGAVRALDAPLRPARVDDRRHLVGGERVPVHITTVWERPFCRLLHFERALRRTRRAGRSRSC